jgi:hypothetical protein
MPQLDFFIFPHIVLQSGIVLLLLALFLSNTVIIKLFQSQKTRQVLLNNLKEQNSEKSNVLEENTNIDTLKVLLDNAQVMDNEFNTQTNEHKH